MSAYPGITPYLGEIRLFAGNFAPTGWKFCEGQILNVADYHQLFLLIGNTYGGDGVNTYALPDLRGRVPLHTGVGYNMGVAGGEEAVTLDLTQIPRHTHGVNVNGNFGGNEAAADAYWGNCAEGPYSSADPVVSLHRDSVSYYGQGQGHENRIPYQVLNYIIAMDGDRPAEAETGASMIPPHLGELRIFSFSVVPDGWMRCDGTLLSVSQYPVLFAQLGNVYGGDGVNNFAIPNLQGRVPMHEGTNNEAHVTFSRGGSGGEAGHTLTADEIPNHTHKAVAASSTQNIQSPQENFWSGNNSLNPYSLVATDVMSIEALAAAGNNLSHNNMAPYLVFNICIAITGNVPGEPMVVDDSWMAEIRMLAGKQVPKDYNPCNGQLLAISKNTAMFSLLGTNFGGDGVSGFQLPDLQARAAVDGGQGNGMNDYYELGETGGAYTVTLTEKETPAHTHAAQAVVTGNGNSPTQHTWAGASDRGLNFYSSSKGDGIFMNRNCFRPYGTGLLHNNLMPYTVVVFCISMNGIFPTRG